jgi:hypothetical protein
MDPRDISTDAAGWMAYDRREEESRRRAGEEYVEREWGDGVQENGEVREVAEGAEEGNKVVAVGQKIFFCFKLRWEGLRSLYQ